MEVRNCRECGKMFNYTSGMQVCPICMRKMDEKFNDVKKYIYDNPGVSIQQVSEEMEVSVKLLKKWVREERLTFAAGSGVGIDCERCGRTILSGRFCDVHTIGKASQVFRLLCLFCKVCCERQHIDNSRWS